MRLWIIGLCIAMIIAISMCSFLLALVMALLKDYKQLEKDNKYLQELNKFLRGKIDDQQDTINVLVQGDEE